MYFYNASIKFVFAVGLSHAGHTQTFFRGALNFFQRYIENLKNIGLKLKNRNCELFKKVEDFKNLLS